MLPPNVTVDVVGAVRMTVPEKVAFVNVVADAQVIVFAEPMLPVVAVVVAEQFECVGTVYALNGSDTGAAFTGFGV